MKFSIFIPYTVYVTPVFKKYLGEEFDRWKTTWPRNGISREYKILHEDDYIFMKLKLGELCV